MALYTLPLREALNDSISSGKFTDTKIILFSRRDSSGTICKPRALYANSHVLKTVPYFNDLLFGTFAESESKDFSEPLDDTECAENYGYHSDSDLEEDEDSEAPKPARGHPFDPFCFTPTDNKPAPSHGEHKERLEKGRVIRIQDMALITFQAFLLYLYTGSIEFAPYGSESNRKSRSVEITSVSKDSIPRPSPKSIYRLADKYDVPPLKRLALDNIEDGLKRCDIVEEVFSEFTSRYDEIRTIQVDHLASVRFGADEGNTKNLCDKIDEKVDAYASGNLGHAAEAVSLLWEVSQKDRHPGPTARATNTSAPQTKSPANWKRVKSALIRSIREGVFVDRKYWTRHSRTGKVLRPVYLSSLVAGEKLPHIDNLVKPYKSEDGWFDKDSGSEDSDCESGLDQSGRSATEVEAGSKVSGDASPVLSTGSFASWKSLFFYLYAESIRFAPLKSQGSGARARYIQEEAERNPHKPPPCSPKGIYSLAVALEIDPLRGLALSEIRSKITSVNVVDEFFSSFTSRRRDIMRMQRELLSDKFGDKDTKASAVSLIKNMASGTGAHHAGALKFGLREGFSPARVMGKNPPAGRDAGPARRR